MPRAPSAVSSAVVPDDTAMQCFARICRANAVSKASKWRPRLVRPHLPECSASSSAVSSLASHSGHSAEAFAVGAFATDFSAAVARVKKAAALVVAAALMKRRRWRGDVIKRCLNTEWMAALLHVQPPGIPSRCL